MQGEIDRIIEQGAAFADSTLGSGQRAQVEFVSANPTGPLHIGNGRGAAIGDTLASVLAAAGYEVEREYYVNDAGTQADVFTDTLYARYQQQFGRDMSIPEGGYPGEYMVDLAAKAARARGRPLPRRSGRACSARPARAWHRAHGRADPGHAHRLRDQLRPLVQRASALRGEGARVRSGAPEPPREGTPGRARRRPLADLERQGQRGRAFRRAPDLFRQRHRLPLRQVHPARVRPGDRRVGGRPPRACLATGCGDGGGHGEGRCPARAPVPAGHAQAGEEDRAPLEAERRDHHARRACRGGGARRGALLLPAARPQFADGVRPGPGGEAVEREPRVLHPIRARAAWRASSIGPSQRGTRPRAGTSPS